MALVESGKAFADYEKNPLAVYNESELLKGLVAYWRHSRSQRALDAARSIGNSIVTRHPKLAGNHYYKSLAIGPLLELAAVTGEVTYATTARAIADEQELTLLRLPHGTHGAAAGMILCGFIDLYLYTGADQYREWALRIWHALRERMFVTGGIGEVLFFAAPPNESDLHDETCQHSWWLLSNLALWRITRESHYLDLAERIFYNHFLFSQLHRGEDGGFCALGDIDQGFRGQHNFICCDTEGGYGFFELLRHAVTADSNLRDVSVNFLLPVEINLAGSLGIPVRLEIATDYPVRGNAQIKIHCAVPADFDLHIRMPGGRQPASVFINEVSTVAIPQDGRITFNRTWLDNDIITIVFPIPSGVETDTTGAGAKSGAVSIDGRLLQAKRIAVLHGPVVAVMFRTGHGNDLNWVWNGDYPEALDSGGSVFMGYPASKAVILQDGETVYHTGTIPQLTEISTDGGIVRLKWCESAGPVAMVSNSVRVLPGLPVTMEWTQSITGLKETDKVLCSSIRYAVAKRTKNPRYGSIAFPYPFPAITTRDDLRASNGFIAGGGSFSLSEPLQDGVELGRTGTLRLSNGSFRTIIHYDPATISKVVGKVAPDWAGVYMAPCTNLDPAITRRMIFPLFDEPLGQDVTLQELERARNVRALLTRDIDGTYVLELNGPVINHTPVLIPKAIGVQLGWLVHDRHAAATLVDYDQRFLMACLAVPGKYRVLSSAV